MAHKKTNSPSRTADLKMEFANKDRAEAFVLSLCDHFPNSQCTVSGSSVKIWASKSKLAGICSLSENAAYARRQLIRLTQF